VVACWTTLLYHRMKNRRVFKRYKLADKSLVDVRSSQITVGPVVDIGMGGLAFHYIDNGIPLDQKSTLNIWSGEKMVLTDISFRICSDQPVSSPERIYEKKLKRCGVCFQPLDAPQTKRLQSMLSAGAIPV
jgi:hypothetical protein